MTQPSAKFDGLDIEPGAIGSRTITRQVSDNDILLTSPVQTVALGDLGGLKDITRVLTVGKGGSGARYATVQAALNAVPDASSETDPTLVLVGTGLWEEDLTIERAGVVIQGFGRATILKNASGGATDTVTIEDGAVAAIPTYVEIRDCRIENDITTMSGVNITGGATSTVGNTGIVLHDVDIVTTGAGGGCLKSDSTNRIFAQGGDWSSSGTGVFLDNVAISEWRGVRVSSGYEIRWDTGGVLPATAPGEHVLDDIITPSAAVLTNLTGAAVLRMTNSDFASLVVGGSSSALLRNVSLMVLTMADTFTVEGRNTKVTAGGISGAGTAFVDIDLAATATFAGGTTVAYTFPVPRTNALYSVSVEAPVADTFFVTAKATTGFTLNSTAPQAVPVDVFIHQK